MGLSDLVKKLLRLAIDRDASINGNLQLECGHRKGRGSTIWRMGDLARCDEGADQLEDGRGTPTSCSTHPGMWFRYERSMESAPSRSNWLDAISRTLVRQLCLLFGLALLGAK